jgi:virginiamycin B lyase
VVIKAGASATLNFTLREAPEEPVFGGGVSAFTRLFHGHATSDQEQLKLVSYDEMYPRGKGRELLEKTCIQCHGVDFIAGHQWSRKQWQFALTLMEKRGAIPPGTFTEAERTELLVYLVKNYGPESTPRALNVAGKIPLDEGALGRAMYIEYHLPEGSPQTAGPAFDNDGNVWFLNRTRIGMLDPRTATFKFYPVEGRPAGLHDIAIDGQGNLWWTEQAAYNLGRLDPKTGQMKRYPTDPNGYPAGGGLHGVTVDHRQDVWFTEIGMNKVGRWDRNSEKITLWPAPTPFVMPYGIIHDRHNSDLIWFANYKGCKLTRFEIPTHKMTEYDAVPSPGKDLCGSRRLDMDSKGTIWYTLWAAGKIGEFNPKTGKVRTHAVTLPSAHPYALRADRQDNLWTSDEGMGGSLDKFDPRTGKFTFYPTPQRRFNAHSVEITREGGIWYCPDQRAGRGFPSGSAVGVLYPDMDKIKTLGAHF